MPTNNEKTVEEVTTEENNAQQIFKTFGIPALLFIIGMAIGFVVWGRSICLVGTLIQ